MEGNVMNRLFLIIYLGVMTAMAPLSTDMYLPALPEFQRDLGISASMTQMTLTMTMIGMAIGQIFGGPVSDKMGRRAPLFLGMAGFTLASLVCSLADDIYVFLIFRFVQGLSGAFGIVVSRAVARDTASGPELMRFLSVLMMVNGIAPVAPLSSAGRFFFFLPGRESFRFLSLWGLFKSFVLSILKKRCRLRKDRLISAPDSLRFPCF